MKNQNISKRKQKLDDLFDSMKDLQRLNNLELQAQWAVYLTIRVSGFLETSVKSIYSEYCKTKKAHPNISRYITTHLDSNRSQNMKPKNILKITQSFSKDWEYKLDQYMSEEGRKEAIDSVINVRNVAAHGGTQGITYVRISDYYKKIWEVIVFMDKLCQ